MRRLLFFVYLLHSALIYSQELDPGIDETVDVRRYSNDFPLDLNKVNKNQLALCKCLKEAQTDAILEHISTYGGFISWYELGAIPELEPPEIQCLSEYFYVQNIPLTDPPPPPAVDKTDITLLMQARWRNLRGFQYRARFDYVNNKNFLGLRFDRDEGERWHWEPKRNIWGVDHISFTYQRRFHGNVKSITLGEYRLHAGMGLVFNAGFFLGKGSRAPLPEATAYVRSSPGFGENEVQNGFALDWNKGPWKVIGGIIRTSNDAYIYSDGTFRSLSNPGYHVSQNDRAKHNKLVHSGLQGIIQYAWKNGYAGGALNGNAFSHPFKTTAAYQQPLPNGKKFGQASLFGYHRQGRNSIWAECAIGSNMAFSIIGGAGRTIGRYSSLVLNFRKYSPGYLTFWGRSLSESSNGHRNETGLYTSFTTERRKRYRFFTFLDLYLVPEASYRHEAGLHGAEFRASYSTWLDRKNEIRWTSRLEWRNQQPGDPANHLVTHKQQLLMYYVVPTGRIMLRHQYNGRFTSRYESGWLTAIEKRFELDYSSLSLFICYFNTSSFYTREFVYERDVWGSFSLPSYFNRGIRALLFYRWRHDNTTLWFRAGLTHTSGKQLNGEIKLQVKYHI